MQRSTTQFLTTILLYTGINICKQDDHNSIWRFIIIFCVFLTGGLSTFMACVTSTDNFYSFANPSPYIATSTMILSGAYFMFHYRTIIGQMVLKMDQNYYTYPDEHLLQITYPWYLQESNINLLLRITKYAIFNVLFVICVPIFGELAYYGRIKTLLFPCWIPWRMDTLKMELFTFVVEFIQACCGLWMNYAISMFLLVTVVEFVKQYHRLLAAVSSLEYRTLQQDVKERCFQEIWFSTFFSIELASSVVTFALALYVAINAPSLVRLLNYFTVVLFIWINILIRCLVSEIFTHLEDKLAETVVWDVGWFKTNKKNRTLLVMFHWKVCHPLRLYGLSIFEATRVTFAKLIRITYSFFNVLNLSLNK